MNMSHTLHDCFKSQSNFGNEKNKKMIIPVFACFDKNEA